MYHWFCFCVWLVFFCVLLFIGFLCVFILVVFGTICFYPHTRTNNASTAVGLNSAQLYFLRMLSFVKTEETLNELIAVVRDFYIKKLQEEADRLWDEGKIGDHLLNEHLRTPYK